MYVTPKRSSIVGGLMLAMLCTVGPSAGWAADPTVEGMPSQRVIARVGSQDITAAELKTADDSQLQSAQSKLLHARYELYLAEHADLDQAINDALVAQAAQKEHLTVPQLLQREVTAKVKDPSEETLEIYFMGTQRPEPFASVKDKLRAYLRELQEKKIKTDYVAQLRKNAHVKVLLDPPHLNVGPGESPLGGAQHAAVTLIEFADYQCPYCRKAEPDLQRLREEYKGQLRYAFRDFPLPMHEHAEKAAEAAHCAGQQGQFWPMHDQLFSGDGDNLAVPQLKTMAQQLGLNTQEFDHCLDSGATTAAVQRDLNEGKQIGLSGTPSFFINGYFLSGAIGYDMLHELIEQQLQLRGTQAAAAAVNVDKVSATRDALCANQQDQSSALAQADICELPRPATRRGSGS